MAINDGSLANAIKRRRAGDLAGAEAIVREVLRDEPNHPDALHLLGILAKQTGRAALAIESISRAMEINAKSPQFHYNVANTLRDQGRLEQAATHYVRALELDPSFAACYVSLGTVQFELGRLDEALENFDRGLELQPHDAKARLTRGLIHLQAGDFATGWREYEWRRSEFAQGKCLPGLRRYWAGEPLDGKTLLVEPEESLADQLMFASCLPDVIAQARRVTIASDARLATLFSRSFPASDVIQSGYHRRAAAMGLATADFRTAIGSLPRYLRTSSESFPKHHGYLRADRQQRQSWWKRLNSLGTGLKIGIAWRGAGALASERSIPLEQWAGVLATPQAIFVSLQQGECHEEIADLHRRHSASIHHWPEIATSDDLDVQAALVAALDLVIAVPNTMVHLAGSLGVEAWTLLAWSSSWRWMLHRDDSLWYPRMRLFRQTQASGWQGVLDRVQRELKDRISPPSQLQGPHRRKAVSAQSQRGRLSFDNPVHDIDRNIEPGG